MANRLYGLGSIRNKGSQPSSQTRSALKLCNNVQNSFICVCSTRSNLQFTSQFFYLTYNSSGINNHKSVI